jgi:Ca-activated chloride channel family protein
MKRNHLLRSILWTCVCLLSISTAPQALAQGTVTEGQLLAVGADGIASRPCPLKHTGVKAEISAFLARVTVTQQFQNPFPDKIEAVYTFPLPQAAAVDDMTIVIGERTVKGKIMKREEAQATYDAAKARGQTAALLHQQRPNIFTQAVANILPGQQINVTISYVETLKYDEGSYEWHFPMVVGERYIPADTAEPAPATNQADAQPVDNGSPQVPDAEAISPPVMPKGMRAGHDISIEVKIDAGVPLIGLQSATHEIEALQPGTGKAMVRLKDQATIPNKDFIVKYDVAGSKIEDALLFHRSNHDGYFTFILQPPERVTVADVTPKELVFVLDTSGSMSGFPIEKAKETMMLALNGLYPQDTFNVILFSGDTKILFSEPKPATPENINKAKEVISGTRSYGGTEMMKAIRAALDPSDQSDHVRIACFMTDGQVGDDMKIIAEVKKHPNARVFAMGFGDSPNRFLLDKITEYGRGEVEYVTENGDAKSAAERFHERVRNPLLTDVVIDWGGLAISDVYPKKIPDLFSAKPVVLSGRYATGGRGVIRLKGVMSGREFVREIPVELPERETQHDVLDTLWARRKVDDLMGDDMAGAQGGNMRSELKTEIVNLGLAHRMMTQFTSFVAVDEQSTADAITPRTIQVPVESTSADAPRNSVPIGLSTLRPGVGGIPSGVSATVTVTAEPMTQTANATFGTTIETRAIIDLPLNGRSVSSLYLQAPGAVSVGENQSLGNIRFSGTSNGQRSSSNNFTLDGVSSNFGVASGGATPGASAGGGAPGLTAIGDTSAMTPFSAIQEVEIKTSSSTAEYGRNTGAVINVVTKSGTNAFHGSAFEFFGNRIFNANDWFANSRGLSRPHSGSNEFGGNFGGPIKRDRLFFFTAYEGLRLHEPVTALTDVPSLTSRLAASGAVRQLLSAYPLPTGSPRPDGFAESAAAFTSRGSHNTGSLRLDFNQKPTLRWSGYYNFTDSLAEERGVGGFSVNTLERVFTRSQIFSGRASWTASPSVVADLRANYNRLNSRSSYRLDNFGGAVIPPATLFSPGSVFDLNGHNTTLMSAPDANSTQRQFNTVGTLTVVSGNHALKFGADYRRTFPIIGLREFEQNVLFDGVSQALSGTAARVNVFTRLQPQRPTFDNFSTYALDEWRKTSRLTLNYGLRWELNPAPGLRGNQLLAVNNADPSHLSFAPGGTSLWATTYGNFAPRFGAAYQLNSDGSFVVRGGFGVFYDTANRAVGDALAESYPLLKSTTAFGVPLTSAVATTPASATVTAPLSVFDPKLKLSYSLQWNASIEREIGSNQVISAAYVASANRRLLLTSTLVDPSAAFSLVRLTNNDGRSDYRSLQLQFRRRFSKGLGAMANYTFGKSSDNFSEDSAGRALFRAFDARAERGPSDFDIRHTLSGYVSYEPPDLFDDGILMHLFHNWSINAAFNVHSAAPVNVVYAVPTTYGFLYLRPDVVPGATLYQTDGSVAGNRRINAAAFTIPNGFRQGTLERNSLRGFSVAQFDFALRRRFNFTEDLSLIVGLEAANIFNHPNFASPNGSDASLGTRFVPGSFTLNPTFGQSFTHAARTESGVVGDTFGSSYYPGGPRTFRLSARLEF